MTTLSDARIAYYGLPRRPNPGDKEGIALWRHELQRAKHRYCVPAISGDWTSMPSGRSHASSTSQATSIVPDTGSFDYHSDYWAGVEAATAGSLTYNFTEGEWHIPCYVAANSPPTSTATQWVGLGGDPGNLLQAGTEADPPFGYRFWYELYSGSNSVVQTIQLPTGDGPFCGDDVIFEVGYNWAFVNNSSVFAEDWTRGWYTIYEFPFVPDFHSAEWIDERVTYVSNGGQTQCRSQLADFNQTRWITALAAAPGVDADHKMPVATFANSGPNYWLIYNIMTDLEGDGSYLAESDAVHSDGKSFTDTWFGNGHYNGC